MNKTINDLLSDRESIKAYEATKIEAINSKLKDAYYKAFENDKALQKAIVDQESASMYGSNEHGIYRWFRYAGLSDFDDYAMEFLEAYVQDSGLDIDWDNEVFMSYEGESIVIQDDTRLDNGVWFNGKCIIDETEYKDDDGVNKSKRNELIEAWMDKEGYFPGVFQVDQHGNVFPVNTQEKS